MAAEEAGQFVYIPAEEGGDSDPVSMDHSESSKALEDKTPASLPKSPKSPASPVKTHVSILNLEVILAKHFQSVLSKFCKQYVLTPNGDH